jgi:large subunit ribosomal protein L24
MTQIIKGNKVKIISGKEKGKTGTVLYVKLNKIMVENINLKTCFLKITDNNKENFVKKEAFFDISKVVKC